MFDQGKLDKMTIQAYQPTTGISDTPQLSEAPEDIYAVQVNPSSYSLSQSIEYSSKEGQGVSASEATFNRAPARQVSFNFVFDGTGVIPKSNAPLAGVPIAGAVADLLDGDDPFVVSEEIAKFSHVVYDFDGERHSPRKVLLVWGEFSFSGALTSLSFDFKLFKPDGTPLRAMATCTFRETLTELERELTEAKSSPDLTHRSTMGADDRLPLMSHRIYGDARHYIEVARHNRLVNFRNPAPGTQIDLPRLGTEGGRS